MQVNAQIYKYQMNYAPNYERAAYRSPKAHRLRLQNNPTNGGLMIPRGKRRYVVRPNDAHLMVYMIEQRLTGTFKMPNDLGAYLALSLPFVLGYFVASWRQHAKEKKNSIWVTLVLGLVVIMMSMNLVLTLTRAAWISVTVATGWLGIYLIVVMLRKPESAGGLRRSILLGSVAIIVFLSLSLFFMPQHIKTRFQTMLEHPIGFMGERPQWWQTSLELIQQYPFTGIGLGRFRYEYQTNGPPEQYNVPYHAHNIYLHIAVEHGIPSLLLFFVDSGDYLSTGFCWTAGN